MVSAADLIIAQRQLQPSTCYSLSDFTVVCRVHTAVNMCMFTVYAPSVVKINAATVCNKLCVLHSSGPC